MLLIALFIVIVGGVFIGLALQVVLLTIMGICRVAIWFLERKPEPPAQAKFPRDENVITLVYKKGKWVPDV